LPPIRTQQRRANHLGVVGRLNSQRQSHAIERVAAIAGPGFEPGGLSSDGTDS
jgi:hypothetical protein